MAVSKCQFWKDTQKCVLWSYSKKHLVCSSAPHTHVAIYLSLLPSFSSRISLLHQRSRSKCVECMTCRVSHNTCLLVTGSMLVAVTWHAGRKRAPAGVLPGKPRGTLLAKLASESRGAGAGLHPRGARAGRIGGDGSCSQGHARELGRV